MNTVDHPQSWTAIRRQNNRLILDARESIDTRQLIEMKLIIIHRTVEWRSKDDYG